MAGYHVNRYSRYIVAFYKGNIVIILVSARSPLTVIPSLQGSPPVYMYIYVRRVCPLHTCSGKVLDQQGAVIFQ